MAPFDPDPEEDDYVSEEDSDFAPEEAQAEAGADELSASDDDEEAAPDNNHEPTLSQQRKRPAEDDLGSGDEAIITKAKNRKKKRKTKDGAEPAEEDDDGGEGGLIKTRSMRAVEKTKRHDKTPRGPVTVDIDALWAQMNSEPVVPTKPSETSKNESMDISPSRQKNNNEPTLQQPQQSSTSAAEKQQQPDTILIKRTYNFAGKVHSEEKLVARDSAEAKLYLASLGENATDPAAAAESTSPKKMPRKAFRSVFEPITDQASQRSDLNLGVSVRLRARELAATDVNAKKLNTVEKSRMDWAGYVDNEGIKDELELAGKSKDSYAARQDFLARSEAKREEDARRVRLAAGGKIP